MQNGPNVIIMRRITYYKQIRVFKSISYNMPNGVENIKYVQKLDIFANVKEIIKCTYVNY